MKRKYCEYLALVMASVSWLHGGGVFMRMRISRTASTVVERLTLTWHADVSGNWKCTWVSSAITSERESGGERTTHDYLEAVRAERAQVRSLQQRSALSTNQRLR